MLRLKKYILPHALFIVLTLFIKLSGAMLELFIPWLMETMLDEKVPAGSTGAIWLYGGLMILCAGGCLLCNVIANRMSAKSAGQITRVIRHDLFQKLQNLSARQLDSLTVSSAESRLTSDTYNVNQLLARLQRVGIRAPILLIGGIAMTLAMDPVLSLVLIGMLPVIALVVYFVTKASVPMYTRQQGVLDKVVRTVQENITGITNPVSSLTLNLGLTLVVVIGAYRVHSGAILSGVIVAFLQYFTMILNAMLGITRIFVMWSKGEASANRVADVLALPEDLIVQPKTESEENPPHIEFLDVNFSYTGIGKNIDSLSFTLKHGQTLGILGPTGSGKSTILNLLLRIYDPDSGKILIDGQDIRTFEPEYLKKKFGVVFQNDFLAEGTIADNIRFLRDLPEEALIRAAADAQAEFIAEKEGKMEAEVMVRGNNLSGGQKQRLLIARALASDPEILILDDASSALDYQTDSRLRQALRQNYRNTTTVLVAQRISSLRHADLILVLQDGCVIGAGNHEQLMESCSEYRYLAQIQMGDGKEAV